MKHITSSKNSQIKLIKSLKLKKNRREHGIYVVEGTKNVIEAVKSERSIELIIASEALLSTNIDLINNSFNKVEVAIVSDQIFSSLVDTKSPQGILALVKYHKNKIDDLLNNNKLIMILDNIQDPGNLGTIIRTADAAGFSGVLLSQGCVDPFNPKVIRSSAGSIFNIPIVESEGIIQDINYLKSIGIKLYAAAADGDTVLYNLELNRSFAFVIGNEGSGIDNKIKQIADCIVSIPIKGAAESLNAAVSASIFMYESLRQRIVK